MTPLWFGRPFIQFRNLGQPKGFLDILLKMFKIVFGRGGRRNPFVFMCLFICVYVCSDAHESQRVPWSLVLHTGSRKLRKWTQEDLLDTESSLQFFQKKILCYAYECEFAGASRDQRRHQIVWSWSYRLVWATRIWLLERELWSSPKSRECS